MIYFDNAATGGFKPDCVVSAATAALKAGANPGRSGHRLSIACLERVYTVRRTLCEFFGGYSYFYQKLHRGAELRYFGHA